MPPVRSSAPFNGILERAPVWSRVVQTHSGSALRFSQPLSGLRKLEFHGLISSRNRSWVTSLQSVPLAAIVYPSRGH